MSTGILRALWQQCAIVYWTLSMCAVVWTGIAAGLDLTIWTASNIQEKNIKADPNAAE